jgi:hypothetical protein
MQRVADRIMADSWWHTAYVLRAPSCMKPAVDRYLPPIQQQSYKQSAWIPR